MGSWQHNMSFTAYLIQPFQNTHENVFFRKVVNELQDKYSKDENKNILVGNLSCGGHLLDAVFFSTGKIIIVDFKDYEGRLEFSENNPWKIYRENDFTFVSGGGGIRNPYQQLNAYRFSLMNVLSLKQDQILSPNHIDIRWDHINCMVLFHKRIQFNNESIPDRIKRFFSVADLTDYITTLKDRFSNNLQLNNNEIENILKILDVRPENIFEDSDQFQIPLIQTNNIRGARLDFVKRHTNDTTGLNEDQKILEYYRTILNLEKFKESESEKPYSYGINLEPSTDQFVLDIASNPNFYAEYLQNGQQQFPQNIFVGINFITNNETLPLFQNIILRSDINNPECVSIKLSDFSIYSKILQDKGLSEDIIDDLISSLNECESFDSKIEIVRNKLEWDIQLASHISVGLSNESLFNAQLMSELKSIMRLNNYQQHPLFHNFLRNEKILESVSDFNFSPMILISELNYSQRRSVRLAFSQPLTVITGPPGTGKTQVVLNIIANAIVNNKTVLFASKNNKAVDNVRVKLEKLLKESDYVLRFGTKSEVRDKTKPTIEKFIKRINLKQIQLSQTVFNNSKEQCENYYYRGKKVSDDLILIPKLEKSVTHLKDKIKSTSLEYDKWINSLDIKLKELFLDKKFKLNVDKNDLSFLINKIKNYKKSALRTFLFNLFQKNRYYKLLKNIYNLFHPEIQSFIESNTLILNPEKETIQSYWEFLNFLNELKIKGDTIEEKSVVYTKIISSFKEKLNSYEIELADYKSRENNLKEELIDILNKMPSAGLKYINEFISQKLLKADPSVLREYAAYIPDNIPWQFNNIPAFAFANQQFLNHFTAIIVTNLSVKNGFALTNQMFDLVVVDEASQCDIASALPLLFRTKKLVVIGDPLQLTHITNVEKYEEDYILGKFELTNNNFNYVENSLYKYSESLAMRSKYESVLLNEHYRSHIDIISFSNRNFYRPFLGQELIIRTQPEQFIFEPKGITWKNVKGQIHRSRNENISEAEICLSLAEQLHYKYPNATIGIITPYRHQAELLRNRLPQTLQGHIVADNVHKYQGDERDIIIFSIVLCEGVRLKKANWINYKVPYLLNVAVSRARSSLIIVGDFNYCRSLTQRGPTPLSQLANYVYSLNRVEDL